MTIQENIDTIKSIKAQIKGAINEKGGNVGDDFTTYANAIKNIETGGSSTATTAGITSISVNDDATLSFDYTGKFSIDNIEWKNSNVSGRDAFNGCTGLTTINKLTIQTTFTERMFEGCTNLESIDFSDINVTVVQDMFKNCSKLTKIGGFINDIYECGYMFWGCSSLSSLPEITIRETGVIDGMFGECSNLTYITKLDGEISRAESTFRNCSKLQTLPLLKFSKYYGQDTMRGMFEGCSELRTLGGLQNLNKDISFQDCPNLTLTSIQNIIDTIGQGDGSQIITFNSNSEDKITNVMRATLVNKGWNIQII